MENDFDDMDKHFEVNTIRVRTRRKKSNGNNARLLSDSEGDVSSTSKCSKRIKTTSTSPPYGISSSRLCSSRNENGMHRNVLLPMHILLMHAYAFPYAFAYAFFYAMFSKPTWKHE